MTLLKGATPSRKGIYRSRKTNAQAATPGHVSRDAVWIEYRLALGRRTIATIVPDQKWPGMWRVKIGDRFTDLVNLSRAKDAAATLADHER